MKNFFGTIMILCCFFLSPAFLFAQPEADKQLVPLNVDVKPVKAEVFKAKSVLNEFNKLLTVDQEIKALDVHLKSKGFVAQKEAKNLYGIRETYEKEGQKVIYTVRLQDYTKKGSKDAAAIGQVTVTAGKRTQTYSFYLFAPNGNFEAMEEFQIDKRLNILKANSWWSCVKSYIRKKCASTCLDALVSCAPAAATVVGYVACVAVKCGGCALKSMVCCACDCSWWCRWAVGCCDR
jgi:hypothetical protein